MDDLEEYLHELSFEGNIYEVIVQIVCVATIVRSTINELFV